MPVPLTVAVPWLGAEASATDVAVPPLRFRVSAVALLPYGSVTLTSPATGSDTATVPV